MKLSHIIRYAAGVGLMLGATQTAFALGTAAGTDISNTATVNFTVSGVSQDPETSNTDTFEVDRKIIVTVAEVGGAATTVVPNSTAQVTTFTVTNTSNDTQDFRLVASQQVAGAAPHGGTDNFNGTNIAAYVEDGTTGGYQATEDTETFIDELAANDSETVYIVLDIPSTQVNGDIAAVELTAVAAQSTDGSGNYVATVGSLAADSAETNTVTADDPAFVDTVFADTAGDIDAQYDGQHSDDDQYNVVTATIAVTKSHVVESDPVNGATNPKAIPGAVIEYCIDVENTGAATATGISISDAVPANMTFVSGSIRTAAVATGATPADECDLGSGTAEDDDAAGADETDPDGGSEAGGTVTVTTPSIANGARFKATFRATVN